MKTKALISIVLIIISFELSGQRFTYGLKGGIALTNYRYVSVQSQDFDPKPAIDFGLVLNYSFSEKTELQIEPGYIIKGARTNYPDLSNPRIFKYRYASLPMIVIFNPVKKLSIEAGPEFSYLFSGIIADPDGNVYEIDSSLDKHFEIAGNIGLSYNLFPKVNAFIRYSQGLTPVQDYYLLSMVGPGIPYKIFNRYTALGIRFMLNKSNNTTDGD